MDISVQLCGNTRLAKRIAAGIQSQSDMSLAHVPGQSSLADGTAARASVDSDSTSQLASACDVIVDVGAAEIRIMEAGLTLDSTPAADFAVYTCLASELRRGCGQALVVPGADNVALARMLRVIRQRCDVDRLYTTIVSRAAHAADPANSSLDGLEPLPGQAERDDRLKSALYDLVTICRARQIIAPCTHTHLHMIKLDTTDQVDRDAIVAALVDDSRTLVASAGDGFRSTANINEFFRDLGRSQGDRWECFVWEESITVEDHSVYLMLDLSPDALPVPEAIDAIRAIGNPQRDLTTIQQLTDQSLGLLQKIPL